MEHTHKNWTRVPYGLCLALLLSLPATVGAGENPQFMIKINDVIFLSDDDIVSYNWQNHSIAISAGAKARLDQNWPKRLMDEWPSNKANQVPGANTFSVVANGELVYSGRVFFRYSSSSYFQLGPKLHWPFFITDSSQLDIVEHDGCNTRSSARVKDVLLKLGVLEQ
ncbi:MAG: hypothetical protein QNL91_10015 [Candidatus Krumholzibacteria bacterium]|nr:hypothetical protein [Candidatus Krumholzibacteria bacterium]